MAIGILSYFILDAHMTRDEDQDIFPGSLDVRKRDYYYAFALLFLCVNLLGILIICCIVYYDLELAFYKLVLFYKITIKH